MDKFIIIYGRKPFNGLEQTIDNQKNLFNGQEMAVAIQMKPFNGSKMAVAEPLQPCKEFKMAVVSSILVYLVCPLSRRTNFLLTIFLI